MRNEPWVWPEVGGAGTSGAGAVPLRSAQMMGQQNKKNKKKKSLQSIIIDKLDRKVRSSIIITQSSSRVPSRTVLCMHGNL